MKELFLGYHDKNHEQAYEIIPYLASKIFEKPFFDSVEAVVFGGSYAEGTFASQDDIDVDLVHTLIPAPATVANIHYYAFVLFKEFGYKLDIRASVDRQGNIFSGRSNLLKNFDTGKYPGGEAEIRQAYTQKHPRSPYVARNADAVKFWDLNKLIFF